MQKFKRRKCRLCDKMALQNRTICWTCDLAIKRTNREASNARCKARKEAAKATKQGRSAISTKNLDNLWSRVTKAYYGHSCEFCGSKENLNSHHVFRRTIYSLRWDYRNCVVLCARHHMFDNGFSAHATPILFYSWIMAKRGREWNDELVKKARPNNNVDRKAFKTELDNLASLSK